MDTILEAKGISKTYKMEDIAIDALRGIDFEIYCGEFVVILGPSGSGKSTMLNIMGGMDTVTDGELSYRGEIISNASERRLTDYRRKAVGFVFQFYNLMPNLTAWENIKLGAEIVDKPLDINKVMDEVGIGDRKDHFPSQLSGGQQQRVAIARAIAKNPDILLCDEPTGALDLSTGVQVLKLLKKFNKEYKKTVIIITHNSGISEIADRVFYIRDGRIEKIREVANPIEPEEVNW